MGTISDNLQAIQKRIVDVCRSLDRRPEDIVVVGVTKFAEPQAILEGVRAGLCHIGENKIQQAKSKFPLVHQSGLSVTKHMIGHLQTNKVKQALELFDMIQSLDSMKLADAIDRQARAMSRTVDALVQVNIAGEEQKFGVDPAEVDGLMDHVTHLNHLRVRGVMTIAPHVEDQDTIRDCFRRCRELFERLKENYPQADLTYLSMGMTHDYTIALEEGANMIRVGRAIFS